MRQRWETSTAWKWCLTAAELPTSWRKRLEGQAGHECAPGRAACVWVGLVWVACISCRVGRVEAREQAVGYVDIGEKRVRIGPLSPIPTRVGVVTGLIVQW
jgi:hypothetical protein